MGVVYRKWLELDVDAVATLESLFWTLSVLVLWLT